MKFINETIAKIQPLDTDAMQNIEQMLADRGLKGQLGYLENILIKYVGITRSATPAVPKKKTIVVCADHGVAKMGVSAYPPETTVEMTRNYLISKGAVANALSNFAASDIAVIDMGIGADTAAIPNLINKKIAYGTANIAKGPAMSRDEAIQSITTGIKLADQYVKEGYRCFLPGEMGIANTTSSAAIAAVCGDLTAEAATGRGTNISDERLKLKISIVQQALTVNRPAKNDGIDILSKVGGFELGCIAGIIIGAAANQAVVMLDGFNTGAAALIAKAICPQTANYLIGSHLAAEKAHQTMLHLLNIQPYMNMNFRLGETTGSSIAINLLDSVIKLLTDTPENITPQPLKRAPIAVKPPLPPVDKSVQEECSLYIDNLAKPIHSLGRLENLAIQLAGITHTKRPRQLKKALVYFSLTDQPVPQTVISFAHHAGAVLYPVQLSNDTAAAANDIALFMDELVRRYQLIALTTDTNLTDTNYTTDLIKTACQHIAAGSAAIIADNDIVLAGAAAACQADDALKDYIITPVKQYSPLGRQSEQQLNLMPYLDLNIQTTNGIGAALTLKLIDASLHMLNDMKTFGTAGVSVANDGPGAGRQDKNQLN